MPRYRWNYKRPESSWEKTAREDRQAHWQHRLEEARRGKDDKNNDDDERIRIGFRDISGTQTPVVLNQDLRYQGVYVIGKPGFGKTNLLRNMILHDLERGNGIGVIAPEQELLTEEILPFIPDHRIDDVIYINPDDTECPVPINPLALEPGEKFDFKVNENTTIFKRLVGETGPRMDEILRKAFCALIGRPGATLLDIPKLLDRTDDQFRSHVIRTCSDPEVAKFWADDYRLFPKDAHTPITTRLGAFLQPATIRNTLCNPDESLSFGQAMDSKKVMLFNLSDGVLGEENSQILGQFVVAKFQLAVMARANQEKAKRQPFYLYLDEFQTFTGTGNLSYNKLLTRARKYYLGLVLAHQRSGQIPPDLFHEILGTVSTTVCFQISADDARRFSREFLTEYASEVGNLPYQEFLRLGKGETWCNMGSRAFFMRTYLARDNGSKERAEYIIDRARRNYGKTVRIAHDAPHASASAPPSSAAPDYTEADLSDDSDLD